MINIHTCLKRVILAKLLLKLILFTPSYLNQEKMMLNMDLQSPAAYYQTQKKITYDVKYEINHDYADRCDANVKAGELEGKLTPNKAYTAKPAPSQALTEYIAPNR